MKLYGPSKSRSFFYEISNKLAVMYEYTAKIALFEFLLNKYQFIMYNDERR